MRLLSIVVLFATLPPSRSRHLTVATAQLRERRSVQETVERMTSFVAEAAARGAQVVVFPEAAITGYGPDCVASVSQDDVAAAEKSVREACRAHSIAAVVGTPLLGFNSALVIAADGSEVCRQHKMQLVPTDLPWSQRGEMVHVFDICGVDCSVIICHDKRYPELVRLPVLAGSRCIFYISAESWHDDLPLPAPHGTPPVAWDAERLERELGVYRAQAQARAVENRVWLVKSNVAGNEEEPYRGSHGQSCIVDPTGMVVCEAGVYEEVLLTHTLDLDEATALYAEKSLLPEYALSGWWRAALQRVKRVSPSAAAAAA